MNGQITGLDLTEAKGTAEALGAPVDEALIDYLAALEVGALSGIEKSKPIE